MSIYSKKPKPNLLNDVWITSGIFSSHYLLERLPQAVTKIWQTDEEVITAYKVIEFILILQNANILRSLLLLLQQKFAKLVEDIEAERTRQAENRKKLNELFQSLMHRSFTGELVA